MGQWVNPKSSHHPTITGSLLVQFSRHSNDAHAFYGPFGFLPADATVMQRPRPPKC